jgi:hypothetical protein
VRVSDVVVEVRDRDLNRLGVIPSEDLLFQASDEFNNVGAWSLKLAQDNPLADALRQPGSGIIVSGPGGVLMSGPTVLPTTSKSQTDPGGSITVEGVSDDVILADCLAWPDPDNVDPTTQATSHDVRQGSAETLLHQYVNANIGPAAPAERRKAKLTMGTNLGRGPTVKKSARFPILGNLLKDIAVVANLGFRVIQRGSVLVFETYEVTDRSGAIRLDVENETLSSHAVAIAPPGATHVIVAGQGEQVQRQFLAASSEESRAAGAAWGRRIERFVDQRQTDDPNEHQQAANEVLAEEGFTGVSIRVVPSDDASSFGEEWGLGDRIAVVVESTEYKATVSGYKLLADETGCRLGVTLGDPKNFDQSAAQLRRLDDTAQRVSSLERNGGTGGSGGGNDTYSYMGVW